MSGFATPKSLALLLGPSLCLNVSARMTRVTHKAIGKTTRVTHKAIGTTTRVTHKAIGTHAYLGYYVVRISVDCLDF